jgi:Domain of unknown function (DUF6935)
MLRLLWFVVVVVCWSQPALAQEYAQRVTVTIPAMPASVEDYVELCGRLTGRDLDPDLFQANQAEWGAPHEELGAFGGAAAFVVAALVYADDPELGLACLTIALADSERHESDDPGNYRGLLPSHLDRQAFAERWGREDRQHVPRSYVQGTSPDDGYALPAEPLTILVLRQASDQELSPEDGLRLFVTCSGAASPRPLRLVRDPRGRWKVKEWSSLMVGVELPAAGVDPERDF